MSFCNYLERAFLNHLFSENNALLTFDPPEPTYLALWFGSPGEDGSGGVEVTGNAYARQSCSGKWGVASGTETTVVKNLTEITFPEATPSGWGTVDYFAICDALTGGNVLAYSLLVVPRIVTVGSIPRFDADALQVFLD